MDENRELFSGSQNRKFDKWIIMRYKTWWFLLIIVFICAGTLLFFSFNQIKKMSELQNKMFIVENNSQYLEIESIESIMTDYLNTILSPEEKSLLNNEDYDELESNVINSEYLNKAILVNIIEFISMSNSEKPDTFNEATHYNSLINSIELKFDIITFFVFPVIIFLSFIFYSSSNEMKNAITSELAIKNAEEIKSSIESKIEVINDTFSQKINRNNKELNQGIEELQNKIKNKDKMGNYYYMIMETIGDIIVMKNNGNNESEINNKVATLEQYLKILPKNDYSEDKDSRLILEDDINYFFNDEIDG